MVRPHERRFTRYVTLTEAYALIEIPEEFYRPAGVLELIYRNSLESSRR